MTWEIVEVELHRDFSLWNIHDFDNDLWLERLIVHPLFFCTITEIHLH